MRELLAETGQKMTVWSTLQPRVPTTSLASGHGWPSRSLSEGLSRLRSLKHEAGPRAELEATVDTLIDALQRFPEVLVAGEPEERKAVVRAFLQEIRIEKTTGQAVLR